MESIKESIPILKELNPNISGKRETDYLLRNNNRDHRLQKVLVANRGEIAKRFFLALHEEEIPSVAVVTDVDRGQSWYEFADEVIFIGNHENYANPSMTIAAALLIKANAIYSGYGFLSENVQFVEMLEKANVFFDQELFFMGPNSLTMRLMGDKLNARKIARESEIPLFESSEELASDDMDHIYKEAERIGYPVIVKLSAGGGGKGMYIINEKADLAEAIESCTRIGKDLYNNSAFYIEKYIQEPVHIEVQIFNQYAIGFRKCAVQRRNQKIIEESGHTFLDDYMSLELLAAAEKISKLSGYCGGGGAGTVEFLLDNDTGHFGFLEMNTRLQVEYAVTDQSMGIDLVKWQIMFYDGRGDDIENIEALKHRISENDHSIECRIYAEEPEYNYQPSPGTIIEIDLPTFNGIRCDFGFGEGDAILPMYDPMIGKIIAHGSTRKETLLRLERALQEFFIKGVKTNINQLLRIVRHEDFIKGDYTNNLIVNNEYLNFLKRDPNETALDRRSIRHILFGAFSEHIRFLQRMVQEFTVIARVEGILDTPVVTKISYKYRVIFNNEECSINFIQTSIDTFHSYVNDKYNGEIQINAINDRSDDLLILFGNSSYRVRINRYTNYLDVKMKDDKNKINYYRMKVIPEGSETDERFTDVRTPFQGTFISFSKENIKVGDEVKKDDPLIILSSMKMETVINAPVDGKITYIIEDGNLEKLQLNKTSDGRIIGKSLQEGDLLIKIETEVEIKKDRNIAAINFLTEDCSKAVHYLLRDDFKDVIVDQRESYFGEFITIFYGAMQGFITNYDIILKLMQTLETLSEIDLDHNLSHEELLNINKIISHYIRIKQLFSPAVDENGLTYQDQFNQYALTRHKNKDGLSATMNHYINEQLALYGVTDWKGRKRFKRLLELYAYVLIRRSYLFCRDFDQSIKYVVLIVSKIEDPPEFIVQSLKKLQEIEQSSPDDSLYKFIKQFVTKHYIQSDDTLYTYMQSESISSDSNEILVMPEKWKDLLSQSKKYESTPLEIFSTIKLPKDHKKRLLEYTEQLNEGYIVKSLVSPLKTVVIFDIVSKETGDQSYIAYSFADIGDDIGNLQTSIKNAASVVNAYQNIEPLKNNRIHIYVYGKTVSWLDKEDDAFVHYRVVKNYCETASDFFNSHAVEKGFLDIDVISRADETIKRRLLLFYIYNDSIRFEYHSKLNENNIYHDKETYTYLNQQLFNNNKWPVELWARECLDNESMEQVTIPFIYGGTDKVFDKGIKRPVASKIFKGTINGEKVYFYMKDSRISGGSTGNREGLKYIAAMYIAYMENAPLYVWNDSAGANIGQGVVSLNRGAEGFMMNSLLAYNTDIKTFRQYTQHPPDPILKDLFDELDEQFGFSESADLKPGSPQVFAAIGIGSSAGLDVYGSSQTPIQVLLDSEESYRVLTGSAIIKTVIGEDITNYDIGGAKVLGKGTGIVDIIAQDKISLVNSIHRLQELFHQEHQFGKIQRSENKSKLENPGRDTLLTEGIIEKNVDRSFFMSFKEEYHAAEELIGGFAKIGGRRVLIMGPRTLSGLRSSASILKARELLKTAYKTNSHQILIFGKNWHQAVNYNTNNSMRWHLDFMNTLFERNKNRINIITHPDGFKSIELNGSSDVIIFINNNNYTEIEVEYIEKNSTFIVDSFEKAFDCALKIIDYIDPLIERTDFNISKETPMIPDNPSDPYDIIEGVILKTYDDGSFIEFYKEMNDPHSGPTLITGLAKLEGETVGIIADQPSIMGGGADAHGTEKFRVFTDFLNRNNIPLFMLSNSSGFIPGSQQERLRIQAIGGESLDVNILGNVPVVSVILNQNYGGRLIHAFNKFLRPGIVCIARDTSVMAVIGSDAAFHLLYEKMLISEGVEDIAGEKKKFIERYLKKAKASNDALKTGLIDWLIEDIKELRSHFIKALEEAKELCKTAFGDGSAEE